MGSIAVTEAGHHFFNRMFGGASAHHATPAQDSTQVQHPPVRPSHDDPAPSLRGGSGSGSGSGSGDTPMADAPAAMSASQSSHYSQSRPGTSSAASSTASASRPQLPQTQVGGETRSRNASVSSQHSNSSRTLSAAAGSTQNRKELNSLKDIEDLVRDGSMGAASRRQRREGSDAGVQYDISGMPVGDIIEMVAGILTKITTTNDRQHKHLHQHMSAQSKVGHSQPVSSVLAFHGKNVPSITILNYLNRIHKYCPTTYEVFLSLLVYFDRMTERVNAGPMQSLRQANEQSVERQNAASGASEQPAPSGDHRPQQSSSTSETTPPPSGSLGNPAGEPIGGTQPPSPPQQMDGPLDSEPFNLSQFFVVDSYNIHRLVIAGVTCASKFFSDVFYTNSRYAKVGGLPLIELNHLELQFLILNDFRLAIPLEELEAYGTMLVEFYAREMTTPQQEQPSASVSADDGSRATTRSAFSQ